MIKNIWALARLDLLLWKRMPLAIASALIPPAGMAILLVVLSFSVTRQPVALVVQSHQPRALDLQKIIESDTEAYLLKTVEEKTANRMLSDQEVAAIITIPKNFDTEVARDDANVDLELNNIDIDFADDIRRAVDRSVAQFDAPQLSLNGEENETPNVNGTSLFGIATNPYRVAINEKDLRYTNVSLLNYQVIPAFILLMISVGLMGTALLCANDIENKTSRSLVLAPVSAWVLIAGRLVGGLIISVIIVFPVLFISFLFGVISPPLDHIPALIALFLCDWTLRSRTWRGTRIIAQRPKTRRHGILCYCHLFIFLRGRFYQYCFPSKLAAKYQFFYSNPLCNRRHASGALLS